MDKMILKTNDFEGMYSTCVTSKISEIGVYLYMYVCTVFIYNVIINN